MDDTSNTFGYGSETILHPLGLAAVLILGVFLVLLPRRYALLPFLIMACFISPAQRLIFLSLNFDLLRIMILFGSARVILRSEYRGFVWRPLDTVFTAWALSALICHVLLYATPEALKYKLGVTYDALGMYFLFRCLVRSFRDLDRAVMCFALIAIPTAGAFLYEYATQHNVFAIFGGVEETTLIRDGKLRCQGAFAHPIIAGCFFAGLAPLIACQCFKNARGLSLGITGLLASATVIVCCSSSTAAMGLIFATLGAVLFFIRRSMQLIRWTVVATLIVLHFIMHASVWHLLANVDLVGGSTGWYRYLLVDQFIQHFSQWAFLGTRSTDNWYDGMVDIPNQYILEAVRGGLLTLTLFIATLTIAFRTVGKLWRQQEQLHIRYHTLLAWGLGVALFVHATNFIGVSYFGQIIVPWYLLLATIASLTPAARRPIPHSPTRPATRPVRNVVAQVSAEPI